MPLRLELFVDDVVRSVDFYRRTLGFVVQREEGHYVSLRREDVVLGLGLVYSLPEHDDGGGFARDQLHGRRGGGVEIVLEVTDLDAAWQQAVDGGARAMEPPRHRPWGLVDFRVVDPDGYYWRVTTSS